MSKLNFIRRHFIFAIMLLLTICFFSCQKKFLCPDCNSNQPPIANAGKDRMVVLPVDSVTLDGSASSDPDGTISSFLWAKISGPASFIITNAPGVKTVVKNLAAGVYQFTSPFKKQSAI